MCFQLTSPADFENLAASAQILTSKPEELTSENVTAAAQIANTLLLSPNASEVPNLPETEPPAQFTLNSNRGSNAKHVSSTVDVAFYDNI